MRINYLCVKGSAAFVISNSLAIKGSWLPMTSYLWQWPWVIDFRHVMMRSKIRWHCIALTMARYGDIAREYWSSPDSCMHFLKLGSHVACAVITGTAQGNVSWCHNASASCLHIKFPYAFLIVFIICGLHVVATNRNQASRFTSSRSLGTESGLWNKCNSKLFTALAIISSKA